VSGHVALRLSLIGIVVTWFVTGSMPQLLDHLKRVIKQLRSQCQWQIS
jgi:hypothetical protein